MSLSIEYADKFLEGVGWNCLGCLRTIEDYGWGEESVVEELGL
jgi:hypothetical protein